MPITEVTQYRTTNGTVYSSFELAQSAEAYEQIVEPIARYIDWEEQALEYNDFLEFLQQSSEAPAFVEAINKVFARNPHTHKGE